MRLSTEIVLSTVTVSILPGIAHVLHGSEDEDPPSQAKQSGGRAAGISTFT